MAVFGTADLKSRAREFPVPFISKHAVRVDTSAGSFELCPADACVVDPGAAGAEPAFPPFALREEITADHPLVAQHREFLQDAGIRIAGIEFVETVDGRLVTYDLNTNTNYNPDVEAAAPASGPGEIARFLGGLLRAEAGVLAG